LFIFKDKDNYVNYLGIFAIIMDIRKLYNLWNLIETPFNCRKDILRNIRIRFNDTYATVCDTTNLYHNIYKLDIIDDKNGIITLQHDGWTQSVRHFRTSEEIENGKIVDEFIHSIMLNSFNFKLEDNLFSIYSNGGEYIFEISK
jgi:hypothetical protein